MSTFQITGDAPVTPTTDSNFVPPAGIHPVDEVVETPAETPTVETPPVEEPAKERFVPMERFEEVNTKARMLADQIKANEEEMSRIKWQMEQDKVRKFTPPKVDEEFKAPENDEDLAKMLKAQNQRMKALESEITRVRSERMNDFSQTFSERVDSVVEKAIASNPDVAELKGDIRALAWGQMAIDKESGKPFDSNRYLKLVNDKVSAYQAVINKFKGTPGNIAAAEKIAQNKANLRPNLPAGSHGAITPPPPAKGWNKRDIEAEVKAKLMESIS